MLICPACSAPYDIPPEVLGPMGRKVSCAKCGNKWHAMPSTPGNPDPHPPVPDIPQPEESPFPQMKVESPPSDDAAAEDRRARIKAAQLTPVKKDKPEAVWIVFMRQYYAIATYGLLALMFMVLIALPATIVQKAPGMLNFYNLIGLPALPKGGGISIVNVRDESRFGAVDNALILRGQLVNHTNSTLKVPMFKMDISPPTGQVKTFMARNPAETIGPGAMVPFSLERPGFAQSGWNVKLTFGDSNDEEEAGRAAQTSEQTAAPATDTPKE